MDPDSLPYLSAEGTSVVLYHLHYKPGFPNRIMVEDPVLEYVAVLAPPPEVCPVLLGPFMY